MTIVRHKNIVECLGCYLDQNTPWVSTHFSSIDFAFVAGHGILHWVCCWHIERYFSWFHFIVSVQKCPLVESEISCIAKETLCGLMYIHSQGYIHRDIKAANLLLTLSGGVKIGDFGSASLVSPANSFVGTPYWIAPEVILAMESGLYDTCADVWSLGITCIEMGKKP